MYLREKGKVVVAGWTAIVLACAAMVNAQITNGDFEGGFTNGLANGWTLFSTQGYDPTPIDETANVHGGAHAQRLDLPQPATEGNAGISQVISTTPGQLYRVDFWVYAHMYESYQGEDLETFLGFDAQGRAYDPSLTDFDISWIGFYAGRDEWRSLGREFLAGGNTTTLFFRAWRKYAQHGGGYIIIDDVTIQPVSVSHPPSVGATPPPDAPTLTGSNLLANPGFENGFTGGVANSWQSWITRGSGTFAPSSNRGKLGGGHYNPDGGAAMMSLTETAEAALAMPPCLSALTTIKQNWPEVLTIGRLYIDEVNFWDVDDDATRTLARQHADNCYIEHLNHSGIDCWQGYNEPWVQSRERIRKVCLFEQAFAERCTELGIRSIVCNLGVGNPEGPTEAEFLKDALAVADFVGYHEYAGAENNEFALRWRDIYAHYEDEGWRHPAVVYTEAGTWYGWKGTYTPTEIRDMYVAFGPKMQVDDWVVGCCFFCVGGYGIWDNWDIADDPIIIEGLRDWNLSNPADARGSKSQQWYHNGSNLRGGIVQAVATNAGDYWLSGWLKYETGVGGDPVNPDITFRIGHDPTGQTSNGDVGTINWSSDQIGARHLNTHIWYELGVPITATGSQTSIWFALDQTTTSPSGRIYIDALDLRAAEGTPPPENPVITLSPTSLSPETDEGSSPPADSFTVRNSGTGTLNYSITDDVGWLSVNPDSGTSTGEADTITVNYSTASLEPGNYNATITVSDPSATNNPQTVSVSLTVNEVGGCENGDLVNGGFESGLSPWVTFGTTDGVVNSGTHGVNAHSGSKMFGAACQWSTKNGGAYQQISVCDGADIEATTWIYTKQSGGANWDVNCRIGIDPTGGTNPDSGNIVWTDWHNSANQWSQIGLTGASSVTAQGDTVTVFIEHWHKWALTLNFTMFDDVEFTATGGTGGSPTIELVPTSLTPETDEGSSPPADTFTVKNVGAGTLNYSISDDVSWLSVVPDSGTSTGEADTITVNYSTTSLDPGNYNATITVSDPNATNNPQTVSVSLTVNEVGGCENDDLVNGGFESGLSPWVTFGTTDGVVNSGVYGVSAHSGSKMFGAACQWSTKNGGAYQQISVCDGADMEVTTWIYTKQSGGANWDVNCRIGIDPTGGTNPDSGNIVWTDWHNSANQWSQIGLTGASSVTAQGDTVTVFIEHWHKWNLTLNFTMFDDVEFTATGGS